MTLHRKLIIKAVPGPLSLRRQITPHNCSLVTSPLNRFLQLNSIAEVISLQAERPLLRDLQIPFKFLQQTKSSPPILRTVYICVKTPVHQLESLLHVGTQ